MCLCLSKFKVKNYKMLFCENLDQELMVIKRDGRVQFFQRSKVLARLRRLPILKTEREYMSLSKIMMELDAEVSKCKIVQSTYIDDFMAKESAKLNIVHPDYLILAKQIALTKLYKGTSDSFSETMDQLYNQKQSGFADKRTPELSKAFHTAVVKNAKRLDEAILHKRDKSFSYFAFKLLEDRYLLKLNGKVVERPQYMFMRVSLDINKDDIEAALESYELMSLRYFIHSTPTLISAGTVRAQMCSNYGIILPSDPERMYECLNQCSEVSKKMGNVAIYCHDYPSQYSMKTSGLPKVFTLFRNTYINNIRTYGNQVGDFTFYVELWHADILEIILLANERSEDLAGLKISILVPQQFMERMTEGRPWSLMCPSEAPGLGNVFGENFEQLYSKYEGQMRSIAKVSAETLWTGILRAQIDSEGLTAVVFKKAYSKTLLNLGILRYGDSDDPLHYLTSSKHMSVYPSAFIAMDRLLNVNLLEFPLDGMQKVVEVVTKNLDRLIDINFYPVAKAKLFATRSRPISIGVHGLASVAQRLGFAYDSVQMEGICLKFFEMARLLAASESVRLADVHGCHKNFKKNFITEDFMDCLMTIESPFYNIWKILAEEIDKYGLRNSTFLTMEWSPELAQLLDTSNSLEPVLSNLGVVDLYGERVLVINENLIRGLEHVGEWNDEVRRLILRENGSIRNIPNIPFRMKRIFKIAWEQDALFWLNVAELLNTLIDHNQGMHYYDFGDIDVINFVSSFQYTAYRNCMKAGFCRIVQTKDLSYPVISIGQTIPKECEATKLLQINCSTLFLKWEDTEVIKAKLQELTLLFSNFQ